MKVLICGVGKVTRHLLKRLGTSWQVFLVDISEEKLNSIISEFQQIEKILAGDASSPVILDEIGLSECDYVLALTDNDKVNLAIVGYARDQGVNYSLALVNEQENQPKFQQLGARTVLGSTLLARKIYHYLQDPRINITPLTLGQAEVMEVDISQYFRMIGKKASTVTDEGWRLAAIYRRSELIFPQPDTVIEPEDRLVIIGNPDIFNPVCDLLECGHPHFPLAYGQGLLLSLFPGSDHGKTINESVLLAQNTKVKHVSVICSKEDCDVEDQLNTWSQSIDIRLERIEGDFLEKIRAVNERENYGLVVVDPLKGPFFKLFSKPVLVAFAHSLPCPLLVSRHTHPYERILVPFNGSPKSDLALEVAVDLARQLGSEISAVVVDEPEFIRGVEERNWVESQILRVREIGHIHKMEIEEITRKGNPVKEIVEAAKGFNLMVMGSATKEKGLFTPHVGELLARDAPCSVLVVTN